MLLISRRYLSVFSVISMFLVLHFFQCRRDHGLSMIYGDSLSSLSLARSYTKGISRFPHSLSQVSIFRVLSTASYN